MPEKLRFGVIGIGRTGQDYLNSVSRFPRAVVVAIAENNLEAAREATERFRIPRSYHNYRELIDQPDIDAVAISLPSHLRAAVAIEALKARKHVLLDKIMALDAKEAAKIVEIAKQMKRMVMVGQKLRFDKQTQIAKTIIQRGDVGEVYYARAFWLQRSDVPRVNTWAAANQVAGGGCTQDMGVQVLDTCFYLLGEFDVMSVTGQTFSKFGNTTPAIIDGERPSKKAYGMDDCSVAMIRLRSGKTVILEVSWTANRPPDSPEYGIELFGTNAGLSLYPARLHKNGPLGYETILLNNIKTPNSEDRLHHFVSCVIEGKKPLIGLDESLKVQQVLDAIYASSLTRKEIRFAGPNA